MTEQTEVEQIADRLEARGHWVSLDRQRTNEKGAAEVLGNCRPRTLRYWREMGIGPAFVAVGRVTTYRITALLDYIESKEHDPRNQFPK